MICYAHQLVNFIVEFVMLNGSAPIHFPIARAKFIMPKEDILKVFDEVLQKARRIEARLIPGVANESIVVQIKFIGGKDCALIELFGGADIDGVLKLDVTMMSDALESATHFEANQRRFALIGQT